MASTTRGRKRKQADSDNKKDEADNIIKKSKYFQSTDDEDKKPGDARLPKSFFDQPCKDLAKSLLGQRLVHLLSNGERLSGDIVETEAYLGKKDSASHTYEGRRTHRVEAMYMSPGTCYVYLIYGMYDCLNISSRGDGNAVLIRALEPKEGISTMRTLRNRRRKNPAKELEMRDLCNGPGKLTEALQITKAEINQEDLTSCSILWLERGDIGEGDIIKCPRVGIDFATEEWVKKPLRFYIRGNSCVSKREKKVEENTKVA